MKGARIIVPTLGALVVTGGVLGIMWWQITQSQEALKAQLTRPAAGASSEGPGAADLTEADTGDIVLLHLRKGDLLAAQGDWAEAETEYRTSVDAGGGIPALRKLAQAQLQRRDAEGATATIEKLKQAGARKEDLLLLDVILSLRTGEVVKAKDELAAAEDSPQKHYGQALVAVIQGQNDAAKTELQLVVAGWDPTLRAYARTLQEAYDEFALFPDSPPLHLQTLLARALAQTQECELALPILDQVLREQESYRDAWMVQGYCELTTERADKAVVSFERAYELDPEKPEIQYFLGRTYLAMKDYQKAATFLGYALQNGFSPEKEVRRHLAEAAIALNDAPAAIDQLKSLMSLPDADVDVAEKLVAILLATDKKDEAADVARTAVGRWTQNAKAYDLLAWAEIERGNKNDAKPLLEKALQLDPTLQSARERYSKL